MPRKKLSEFRAKNSINASLGLNYFGLSVDGEALPPLDDLDDTTRFVVKVDQGVKGRFKQGLVLLDVEKKALPQAIETLRAKGYRWLIIEPMVAHDGSAERYLAISRTRGGVSITYSQAGGVDIESHTDLVTMSKVTDNMDWKELALQTGIDEAMLRSLLSIFDREHMTSLEINPYIITPAGIRILDLAIEVDDAGAYFATTWTEHDFRQSSQRTLTAQEQTVLALDDRSPASFKLDVINPNGSVFLLLSGGGASVVVADEVYARGFGKQLANYGEYSGGPGADEVHVYALAVLQLLLASGASKKVLFIGGAVANFTNIANTFAGIIAAFDDVADELQKQEVKVFVRRGGPQQEIGLAKIETALKRLGIFGAVHSPETPITVAVGEALESIR
jgi:succinyl-CoA synthetase beta subunit